MSDDYDVQIWEEVKIEEVILNIDTLKREDLIKIEESEKKCLLSKLEKLNVVLKNLDVYCKDGVLLVNDRYGICKEFPEIAAAFGFTTEAAVCSLKGRSYLVYDPLFALIHVLDPLFDISHFANKQVNVEILSVLGKVKHPVIVSGELQAILQTILQKGHYTVKGTQKIVTTYEDGREINRDVGEIVSEENSKIILKRCKTSLKEQIPICKTVPLNCFIKEQDRWAIPLRKSAKGRKFNLCW